MPPTPQKRIVTIEIVQAGGDRRRLQYGLPVSLQRQDWNNIIALLDEWADDVLTRQEAERSLEEQARIERGRVQGQ